MVRTETLVALAGRHHPLGRRGFATGRSLASGEWVSTQPYAPLIPFSATVLGVIFFGTLATLKSGDNRLCKLAYPILCGIGGATALALDAFLFPSLYPAFHQLAFGLSAVLMFLFALAIVERISSKGFTVTVRVVDGIVAVVVLWSLLEFAALTQSDRAALLLNTRTAEYLLPTVGQIEKKGT